MKRAGIRLLIRWLSIEATNKLVVMAVPGFLTPLDIIWIGFYATILASLVCNTK